jgi:hypothetical protein
VKLFADDTNEFVFENSSAALNQKSNFCINELNMWFIVNELSLNLTNILVMWCFYTSLVIVLNYVVVNMLL